MLAGTLTGITFGLPPLVLAGAFVWARRSRRLPVSEQPAPPPAPPDVAVVIAARNEEDSIQECVESVLAQDGIDGVIVVDDHSSDKTAAITTAIASRDKRVRLVHATDLPVGWLGKTHALQIGATLASSTYILFTDADIHFHGPVVKAVRNQLETDNLDHVGGLFGITCHSASEEICAPVLSTFALVAMSLSAHSKGQGTGAFNMVRRTAYEAVGRHSLIKDCIVDDVALAQLFIPPEKTRFFNLSPFVTVRLFKGLTGYMDVVGRAAIPFLKSSPPMALFLSLLTMLFAASLIVGLIMSAVVLSFSSFGHPYFPLLTPLLIVTGYLFGAIPFLANRACRNNRTLLSFLYPFALLIMGVSIWKSARRMNRGDPLVWRGRSYQNMR